MVQESYLPLLAVVISLVSALVLSIIPQKSDKLRNALSVVISAATLAVVIPIVVRVYNGTIIYTFIASIGPNLDIALKVDLLGALFGGLASFLWVFSVIYSTGYMAHEHNRRRYFVFFLLSLGVTMGIAFSDNLFTFYLFYEFLTICTYPLVIHEQDEEAQDAGKKYIIYSFIGAGFVLLGLFSIYGLTGGLAFSPGGILQGVNVNPVVLQLVFLSLVIGFGVKAAIMPLHAWLPAAMAAPTPVSALLHAVAVVKSGVFGILRVMYSIYGKELLADLGLGVFIAVLVSITILVASIIALQQDVLKKRLAYSTISQLGYITLGAALLPPQGLAGGLIHIINHALLKIALFFCAGSIITVTGKKRISELNGVGRQMPLTMIAFAIASIGMVGIPPVNGFISKWFLIEGSLKGGQWWPVAVLIGSALLNAAYFFPIVIDAFFKPGNFKPSSGWEAPPSMLITVLILTAASVLVGIDLNLTVPFVERVAAFLF